MKDDRPIDRDKGNGRGPSFQVIDRRGADAAGEPAASESRLPTVVEQYKTRAEEAEQRAREISAAYRRIEEERDAFRERLGRDLERRLDIARAEMMRKVIDVLDDLDRAIEAARVAPDPDALRQGITLIRDRLFQILASEGVERIETVGRPFDPGLSEAVATE
ncbi:MAG TPA: nucleotide exchange factor GrpE, partial [Candidatus Polarisedimenticolia bacterium]|nr:nucleotide exchange factor GrpE [Candidatus Polarisedimenticolia bacterium]